MPPQRTVSELMTEAVLSVDVDAPVSEALRLLSEYPVHHLPVVRERKLVGMLSSADVSKIQGFLPRNDTASREYLDRRFKIEMLMSTPPISIRSSRPIEDAARLMVSHAVHALPVVNEQDCLLGILTTTDMMQALLFSSASADTPVPESPRATTAPAPHGLAVDEIARILRSCILTRQEEIQAFETILTRLEQPAAADDEINHSQRINLS